MEPLSVQDSTETDPSSGELNDPQLSGASSTHVLPERYPAHRPAFQTQHSSVLAATPVSGSGGHHKLSYHRRSIGFRYIIQVWKTGLPLLLNDLATLVAGIAFSRLLIRFLGGAVGFDISSSFIVIATGFTLISAELGLYPGIRLSPVEEFRRIAVSITFTFAMWAVGLFIIEGSAAAQSWFLLVAYISCLLILPVTRGWARRILSKMSWWGFPTLICGDDSVAVNLHHWLKTNSRLGFRPVGVIANRDALEIDSDDASWYLGEWSDAHDEAEKHDVYWAIVVPSLDPSFSLGDAISRHLGTLPHIHVLSELTGLPDHWNHHQQVDGLSGIHLQQNLLLPQPRAMKRMMDVSITLLGGILLLPLLLAVAIAIKLTSKGPIFFGHGRIGREGKMFRAWKFRTMAANADEVLEQYLSAHPELREEWEKDHKLKDDPRITKIGKLLRKTSIDELPQIWNVLRGDMSLVGPRPIVTAEIEKYGEYFDLYTIVLPGITGLWQVSGRNDTTYEERVKLDSYYVRNWSPWMDLYLLMRTIKIVLLAEGAY